MSPADFFRLADRFAALEPDARALAREMLTPPPPGAVDNRRASTLTSAYRSGELPPPAWWAAATLTQALRDAGVQPLERRPRTAAAYLEADR